jgi:hypothetical protein
MPDAGTAEHIEETPPLTVGAVVVRRRRRRRLWRLVGSALVAWGLIGLVLLAVFFNTLAAPISELNSITGSVNDQRTAALDALDAARNTINQTADAVRGMDLSLADAKAATDRSSTIALGVASSMNQLAGQMTLSIFGVQPLIGLASGFSQSGSQLTELSADLTTISTALESNRDDTVAVAGSLDELGTSLDALRKSVANGPQLEQATKALDNVRVGILALLTWLGVLAVGSIAAGLSCWVIAREE